jgi:hypothetical protein
MKSEAQRYAVAARRERAMLDGGAESPRCLELRFASFPRNCPFDHHFHLRIGFDTQVFR